ncbi:MAG: sigma-70 family RNA polymerase sigma factor [Saprospiraceae bacterium]|nr:sigma-70 family RNA polymerase sigma factor [Saprospiraceae bacterium]
MQPIDITVHIISMQQEAKIIELFKKDPLKGLKLVHELYAHKMMFLAKRYISDDQIAEEMVSDTFLTVFQKWHQYDENKGSAFLSWMSKICINRCLMELRKNKIFTEQISETHENIFFEIPDQFTYRHIVDTIQALGHPYNTIFFLHEADGFNHFEISEMLGIPVGSSKSYLHRAKKRLQKTLFDLV